MSDMAGVIGIVELASNEAHRVTEITKRCESRVDQERDATAEQQDQ